MKRYGKSEQLWQRICDDNNIEKAMRASLIKHKYPNMRNSDYNRAQKYMIAHWDECKEIVRRTLTSETYHFAPLHSFKVFEPKERVIHCPQHCPDKIIMICVYNVLRDYFYSKFVRNTYNCIKGRGIHDAKRAIEHIMRTHPDWYYVQTDIRKFYPTLRHDILKSDLRKVFKDVHVLKLLDAIIDVFHEGVDAEGHEIGIAIGINLSQLMAILTLIPILREINETWKYPCVDFTDDVFVAIPTKRDCHVFMDWYVSRCAERGLLVKPNFRIAPMTTPVRMIGYEFRLNERGQQYTLLAKPIKVRMKRRAKQLDKMNLTDDEWKQQMASYFGWCKHAKCKHLMRVTFGERYELFYNESMQTFKDIKGSEIGEFGIAREKRVSVLDLLNQPICFDDAKIVLIKTKDERTGEEITREKVAIKFRYSEGNEPIGEQLYMISGSDSLKDRATDAQPKMPFIGTIIQKQTAHRSKYYVIE